MKRPKKVQFFKNFSRFSKNFLNLQAFEQFSKNFPFLPGIFKNFSRIFHFCPRIFRNFPRILKNFHDQEFSNNFPKKILHKNGKFLKNSSKFWKFLNNVRQETSVTAVLQFFCKFWKKETKMTKYDKFGEKKSQIFSILQFF